MPDTTVAKQRRHPHYRLHCILERFHRWILWSRLLPIHQTRRFLAAVLTIATIVLGVTEPQPNLPQVFKWLGPAIEFCWKFRFLITMGIVIPWVAVCLFAYVVPPPLNVKAIEAMLDQGTLAVYPEKERDHGRHVYRATLFKARWFPGAGRWLGAVARSGARYRTFTTVFSINPDVREENTGFAGECWMRVGQTICLNEALPDPSDDVGQSNYCAAGWVASEEYANLTVVSRTLIATGVFVHSQLWGVLVFDTDDPGMHPSKLVRKHHCAHAETTAKSISLLLEHSLV